MHRILQEIVKKIILGTSDGAEVQRELSTFGNGDLLQILTHLSGKGANRGKPGQTLVPIQPLKQTLGFVPRK